MTPDEIRTLRFLEALEKDPTQTQRDLSLKLKISLGLVNAFTKRLAKKGYFKITTIPRNRIRYILTPKGMAEKAKLTYQYVSYSLQYYINTRARIKDIFKVLKEQGKRRIYFLGVSELAEIAYITLQEENLELAAIIDDEMAGKRFIGLPIKDLTHLKMVEADAVIVVTKIGGTFQFDELLSNNNIEIENIIDRNF